ncbi:hypothetical protein DY000_02052532 [Brassica cretica]|uniref:Aspartic peptidase DDI1-type domain-containing protein n=1 Tax=Brassica cretica TaxID=69181 RepID=A0ABQ7A6A0_BRACR|nr:hypothetical protein DY000_02052532 [Brassica cretica]
MPCSVLPIDRQQHFRVAQFRSTTVNPDTSPVDRFSLTPDDFWQVLKEEKLQEENRSTTPTESTASCNAVKILTHEEFAAKHPHPPSPVKVRIDPHANSNIDRHSEAHIDRQPSPPIDRCAPITYRVQMPKIDVARLNALRPKPKPSEQPPEPVRTPSDDGDDPMEEDRVSTGRTLRRRKENVAKHLKRETREKEEDIRRMFCEAREKMRRMITLKKKSDPGQFAIPCTVQGIEFSHVLCDTRASVSILPRVMADHLGLQVEPSQELFTFVDCSQKNSGGIVRDLELQIGNTLVPVDFHVLDIKLNWNTSLLLGRAFLSTVGAVCNLKTNQLCLTLIDPNAHYDPIPVKKPQTISRRINDPGIIAACHCGDEYETEFSESIETHTTTSIDSGHQKSTDIPHDESVDGSPEDWENDYYNPITDAYKRQNTHTDEYDENFKEERAIEYRPFLDEEDKLLHHSSWKRNAPSFDMTRLPSIDTQPQQRCQKQASTDTAYYKSVDTDFNRVREGDYSIGSWANEHHHESFAVETITYTPGADKLQDSFTDEELLNMQKRDDTYQFQVEAAWERTRSCQSIDTCRPN